MNDLPDPREPHSPPQDESLWDTTVAFLKRDIRTFLPGNRTEGQGASHPAIAGTAEAMATPPVEPLVDHHRLPCMAFRREVLDWRDNFHANVATTIIQLQSSFIQQIEAELGNTSMFRKLVTRPASEVLQDGFVRTVRLPLITALRKEEAALHACAQKWALFGKAHLEIDIRMLTAECDDLKDIGFKPSNRDLLVARMQALLLGPGGTEEQLREQGLHISRQLLEARTPC